MLVLLLAPVAWFAAMYWRYQPVRHQHALTSGRTPEAFDAAVRASGGAARTRTGLLLDLGFIAATAATVPAVLAQHGRAWWVPFIACGLDLLEDALALRLLSRGATVNGAKLLAALATAKLIAYGAVLYLMIRVGLEVLVG